MIALQLAVRNLLRNRWRTALTLGGVAVAVGLMVWTLAFYEGWIAEMVRGATAVETGQVQLQTAGYAENPRVYRAFPVDDAMLSRIAAVPGVLAVSPRVVAHGLVGNEERSRVSRIVGVDPEREAATTVVTDGLDRGRWLAAAPAPTGRPREVVLGADLARHLRVEPGDELVVFLEGADGSLGNDLLEVVGTVRTRNTAVDRMAAYVHIDDARWVAALGEEAHEVVVRTADLARARETAAGVARAAGARTVGVAGGARDAAAALAEYGEDALVARPWQDILPGLDQMILMVRRSYWVTYLFIYLVAAVGILNTQRMSALERRREFGVMLAVGVKPRRMFRMVQVETVVLGLAGAALGALLGGLLSWYHAVAGFDMASMSDQASFSYMGVAFSERIHFVLSPTALLQPVLVMLLVALVSGLWPSFTASRLEPAPTIAGRT